MNTMSFTALLPLILIGVCFAAAVDGSTSTRRCRYDSKGVEWSACSPELHVKTKTMSLRRGRKICPQTKTITKPCKAGVEINGCVYVPVSMWSDCDPVTHTTTRTLELRSKTSSDDCDNHQVESEDCRKDNNKTPVKGKQKKKKRRRKDKKMRKKGGHKGCKYKKGKWSDCDTTLKKMVRTSELRPGSPSSCKGKKTDVRSCRSDNKKSKKNKRKDRKRKKKNRKERKKHKKEKKDKKGKKGTVNSLLPTPPKLTEMRVWPLSTSVEVSWKPPTHGTVRGYQVSYGISIPDVYKTDLNASVLHYIIPNLEPEQEYIVSVRARNKAGLGSPLYETVRTGRDKDMGKSGQLLLAPVELRARTLSAYSIDVSWTDSSILKLKGGLDEGAGKMYTVRYMQLNHLSKTAKPRFVTVNTTQSSLLVTELLPYTRYEFAVRVSQATARSVWSLPATNTTFPSAPSSKPADFTADIDQSDPTTVVLTWQPPEEPNGPITGYVIFYSKDPILPDAAWAMSVINGNRLTTVIKDLDPNAAYFFKIQARNQEGVGPTTSPVTVTVPDVLPSVPRNLTSEGLEHNPQAVRLRWQRPERVQGPITGYLIYYTDDPNLPEQSWVVEAVLGDHLTNIIKDLQPNAKYFFKLQARSKAGNGPPTNPISHLLPDVHPSVPRNLTATQFAQLPTAVLTSWLPPLNMGEPIIGYVVMYSEEHSQQWSAEGVLGESHSVILRGLEPGTTYRIKVQARTEERLGPTSPILRYTTPEDLTGELQAPTDLKVYILSSTSAIMSWRDPLHTLTYTDADANTNNSTYTVRYRALLNSTSNEFSNYTYISPPFFPSLYLVDLTPNVLYQFSVRLNRDEEHSAWSVPIFNKTLEAAPSTPPVNVSVSLVEDDPTMAAITWSPPLRPNGAITGYLVFASTQRKQPISEWQIEAVKGDQTRLTVSDLSPNTKFFFKIQARNAKGYGPLSPVLAYKTPKVHGGRAEDVTVRPHPDDPYSAIITWQPPTKGKRRISHYVLVRLDVEAEESQRVQVAGDTLTAVVHQLLPARSYRFTVQPRYRHHAGPHSKPVDYVVPKELLDVEHL